eukprot:CAMPEP_0115435858 /NCGR_PEP_ID=MMETSP0271-20121206/33882_1 /TAXON_ID=71861 /ORGANISM="Scrippsiella trochoidea, Strain CCMP3099" /LENGTH=269 /DNA_ID=CAMNT_0002861341 /DNA_START=343 /DNA_END=1148 /DNA_ORIENTATION=+
MASLPTTGCSLSTPREARLEELRPRLLRDRDREGCNCLSVFAFRLRLRRGFCESLARASASLPLRLPARFSTCSAASAAFAASSGGKPMALTAKSTASAKPSPSLATFFVLPADAMRSLKALIEIWPSVSENKSKSLPASPVKPNSCALLAKLVRVIDSLPSDKSSKASPGVAKRGFRSLRNLFKSAMARTNCPRSLRAPLFAASDRKPVTAISFAIPFTSGELREALAMSEHAAPIAPRKHNAARPRAHARAAGVAPQHGRCAQVVLS